MQLRAHCWRCQEIRTNSEQQYFQSNAFRDRIDLDGKSNSGPQAATHSPFMNVLIGVSPAAFGPRIAFTFSVSLIYLFARKTAANIHSISFIWKIKFKSTYNLSSITKHPFHVRSSATTWKKTAANAGIRQSYWFNLVRFRAYAINSVRFTSTQRCRVAYISRRGREWMSQWDPIRWCKNLNNNGSDTETENVVSPFVELKIQIRKQWRTRTRLISTEGPNAVCSVCSRRSEKLIENSPNAQCLWCVGLCGDSYSNRWNQQFAPNVRTTLALDLDCWRSRFDPWPIAIFTILIKI